MIVAFTGLLEDMKGNRRIAGAGKDEAAAALLRSGFVSVAFADIMKRWCKELFGFTDEQLWGASEERAKPDKRYPRRLRLLKTMTEEKTPEQLARLEQLSRVFSVESPSDAKKALAETLAGQFAETAAEYLTVRYALQKLGDWGRDCYPDIWANKALEIAKKLMTDACLYTPQQGLVYAADPLFREKMGAPPDKTLYASSCIVIPDCRFQNEFRRVKEEGGSIIRVKRLCAELPDKHLFDDSHVSERDILAWGDEKFDHVIENNGTVAELHYAVLTALGLPTIKFPAVVSY